MSTSKKIPPPDPKLITIFKVEIAAPSNVFSRHQDELPVDVTWQVKYPIFSRDWHLHFSLESLTPDNRDHDLADLIVPGEPDSLSYTAKSKLYLGKVAAGVYKLQTLLTYPSTPITAYDEQVIQILPE